MAIKHHALSMLLFFTIAIIAVYYLMSPAVPVKKTVYGEEIKGEFAGLLHSGMDMRYEAWTEYPKYNTGMGILAGIGFVGGTISGISMCRVKRDETD